MATYKDFKNIPDASKPVKQPIGTQNEAIDKYIAENIKDPTIANAAKQSYTDQTVQQNELLSGSTLAAPTTVGQASLTAPTIVGATPASATTVAGPSTISAPPQAETIS